MDLDRVNRNCECSLEAVLLRRSFQLFQRFVDEGFNEENDEIDVISLQSELSELMCQCEDENEHVCDECRSNGPGACGFIPPGER